MGDPRVFLSWASAYEAARAMAILQRRRQLVIRDRKLPIWYVAPREDQ